MFQVTGAFEAVAYDLTVLDEEPWVQGSPRITAFLERSVGEQFMASSTGPMYVLDLSDQSSVLAALADSTIITETSGDVPDILPPSIRERADGITDS